MCNRVEGDRVPELAEGFVVDTKSEDRDYPARFAILQPVPMMNKPPSAEKAARLERRRLAAEDGSKALQEVAERAIAIRENMARLRALRFAKEAREIATEDRAATVKTR